MQHEQRVAELAVNVRAPPRCMPPPVKLPQHWLLGRRT